MWRSESCRLTRLIGPVRSRSMSLILPRSRLHSVLSPTARSVCAKTNSHLADGDIPSLSPQFHWRIRYPSANLLRRLLSGFAKNLGWYAMLFLLISGRKLTCTLNSVYAIGGYAKWTNTPHFAKFSLSAALISVHAKRRIRYKKKMGFFHSLIVADSLNRKVTFFSLGHLNFAPLLLRRARYLSCAN